MPRPFGQLLRWLLSEADKAYRFRDESGGTLVLAQRSDDRAFVPRGWVLSNFKVVRTKNPLRLGPP